jgi:unsaturated rhamnogalacturonyl hydrolase
MANMRRRIHVLAGLGIVVAAVLMAPSAAPLAQTPAEPLAIARVLAAKYPAQPIMSYIPALAWSSQARLFELTGETQWRDKALKDIEPFTTKATPAFVEPYRLTSLAGALGFHDVGVIAQDEAAKGLARVAAMYIAPVLEQAPPPDEAIRFRTGWTDDMFMASAVLSRGSTETHAMWVHRMLTTYATKLQRPDGLFIHATDGPHAWGRGNGFALLGVTEALTHLPPSWAGRSDALAIYRRHVAALAKHQSDDGSWRQVVDEPTSYRELTVTAMTIAAMARGVRLGWIDRKTYEPSINRGWNAVAARVNADGTVKDVCSGTGVGPTKEYYLNRPVVNGADDRGGAMALLAAIEMELLRRSR